MTQGQHCSRRTVVRGGVALSLLTLVGCAGGSRKAQVADASDAALTPNLDRFLARTSTSRSGSHEPIPNASVAPPAEGVIPRRSWSNAGVARPRETNAMNGVRRITVHHDGMPPVALRDLRDVAARIESIRQSHVRSGWADIGYHYVIDPTGHIWQARSVELQGAHVRDNNEHNLGIMVLGNFQLERPTGAALSSLGRFLTSRMRTYRVPISRVYTHREIRPTECPGANLQRPMETLRERNGLLARALVEAGDRALVG